MKTKRLVLVAIFLLIITGVIITVILTFPKRPSATIKNPERSYWLYRSDGTGVQEYMPEDGIYLRQTITPVKSAGKCSKTQACPWEAFASCTYEGECIPHCNSEIYNSSCCSKNIDKICQQFINEISSSSVHPLKRLLQANNIDTSDLNQLRYQLCQLLKTVCGNPNIGNVENEDIIGRCNLVVNPLIIDNPLTSLSQMVQDMFFNLPYKYADLYVRVRAKNMKNGSRGWGFWNTTINPTQTYAWFMHQNGVDPDGTPYFLDGFYIMIVLPSSSSPKLRFIKLPDLDEEWHDYRIKWTKSSIQFYIDGKSVYVENEYVPDTYLSFHFWVDNVIYGFDSQGIALWTQKFTENRSQELASFKIINYK